jgi:uncharacterized protein (TIGR03086 family)
VNTSQTARRSPWGGVELLERAIAYTRGCLALVTDARLPAATPCEAWDLRALLMHMEDSLTSLHEAGTVRRVTTHPAPGTTTATRITARRTGDELVDALRSRACQLLADWSGVWSGVWSADWADPASTSAASPGAGDVVVDGRPLTSSVLTSAGALEIAVHGWDVSVACGADRPLPDALARDLLHLAPVLVSDADRPSRFAHPLPSSSDDPASDRLLAFLGRLPR